MVNKKVAFRVDASSQIGTGHFTRCLTLADALKRCGAHVRFVSRALPAYMCDMLATKNIEFVSLENETNPSPIDDLAHAHWLGTSQAQDVQATVRALSGQSWDWLIVDHYALDARWESALRKITKQIMVIDDIADRRHDCDLLLDQNLYENIQTRYVDKVPAQCGLLLGPRYALLRDEFRKFQKNVKTCSGLVKRILVFFGGVDVENYTGLTIEILSKIDFFGIHVDVVIGAQHPHKIQIMSACVQHGYTCYIQTERMAELMAAADLAIGAGGSVVWERIYLCLPTLVKVTAFNQRDALNYLETLGYIDIWRDGHELRNILIARIKSNFPIPLLDIRIGTGRVCEHILSMSWIIPFSARHIRRTFKWLLCPQLREAFLMISTPTVKQHCKYWRSVLNSSNQIVFAIVYRGKHVGNCGLKSINRKNKAAELWIYIGEANARGLGLGKTIMKLIEEEAKEIIPDGKLFLHVGKTNKAAIKLYQNAGYKFSSEKLGSDWSLRGFEVLIMEKVL